MANSLKVSDELNHKKLNITIMEVPCKFTYENKGSSRMAGVATITMINESIIPHNDSLIAEFTLSKKDTILLNEKLAIASNQQLMTNKLKSPKKFTWKYLDAYKKEIENLGNQLMLAINKKLVDL